MRAVATLVTSDDFVQGAQVLAYSLQRHCHTTEDVDSKSSGVTSILTDGGLDFELVVLVTPSITAESRRSLRQSRYKVVEVPPIPNPNTGVHVQSWIECGFTKLRIWTLTQYSRVLYIDADCLVVRDHTVRDAFVHCKDSDFSAAPDTFPPDRFNAGVLMIRPDTDVFRDILRRIPTVDSYDGGDTGFLNDYFPDWHSGKPETRLPFGYNALRTMQWFTKAKPSYWNHGIRDLRIVHYCSSPKPWELPPPHLRKKRPGPLESTWMEYHASWKSSVSIDEAKEPNESSPDHSHAPIPPEHLHSSISYDHLLEASFEDSMGERPIRFGKISSSDHTWVSRWKDMFGRAVETAKRSGDSSNEGSCRIPRIVHQIWIGGEVPQEYHRYMSTWENLGAEWQYRLWTDADIEGFDFDERTRRVFDAATNPAEKSDIWRYAILEQIGGLYVDTDFECIQNESNGNGFHSSLFRFIGHSKAGFFTGVSNTGYPEVNNGLIASAPNHPFLRFCIESLEEYSAQSDARPPPLIERTGPMFFTRRLMEFIDSESFTDREDVIVFPTSFFYPVPNTMRALPDGDKNVYFRPETFAVHHWACSWQKLTGESDPALETQHTKAEKEALLSELFPTTVPPKEGKTDEQRSVLNAEDDLKAKVMSFLNF